MAKENLINDAIENVDAELSKEQPLADEVICQQGTVALTAEQINGTKSQRFWRNFKKEYSNWLFMAPFIVGFLVFMLYPLIASLVYSFSDITVTGAADKWGFAVNYGKMFMVNAKTGRLPTAGRETWDAFKVTGLYAILSIPINVVLAYSLALALRKNIPGIKVLRLLFYLPVLIPGIVGGQIWLDILQFGVKESELGIINQWLLNAGVPLADLPTFFRSTKTEFWTVLVIAQWGIGGGMIVWLAALENVPKTLYEAADIDGASYFTKLFRITLPMSTPIIFYNLIGAIIGSLQMFDTMSYLGQGIGEKSMNFVAIHIYVEAFNAGKYGFACAVAWLLFIVIGILTAIMFKFSGWVFYGDSK